MFVDELIFNKIANMITRKLRQVGVTVVIMFSYNPDNDSLELVFNNEN